MPEPMNDWKEHLRDLYLITSPDENDAYTKSILFNWGKFNFIPEGEKAEFYLATKDSIEDFIAQVERDAIQRTADALMLDEVEINNPFNDYVRGYVQAVKDLRTKRDKLLEECK